MKTETKFTVGEYKTRDGRRARVYATDGVKPFHIHGATLSNEGWLARTWTADGHWSADEKPSSADLMPPLREWWIVEWHDGSTTVQSQSPHNDPSFKAAIAKRFFHVREVRDDQA